MFNVVETNWTDDTRVEYRSGYICILYVALYLLPFIYGDDALMIQLDKVEFNS